eukprot:COSAG05_NODE_6424_length_961_cov_1.590487_1_plen_133_part_10
MNAVLGRLDDSLVLERAIPEKKLRITLRLSAAGVLPETAASVRIMAMAGISSQLAGAEDPLPILRACGEKGICGSLLAPALGLGGDHGGSGYGGGGRSHLTVLEAFVEAEALRMLQQILRDFGELSAGVESKQ